MIIIISNLLRYYGIISAPASYSRDFTTKSDKTNRYPWDLGLIRFSAFDWCHHWLPCGDLEEWISLPFTTVEVAY